jgi:alpha-L-fucosidase
MRKHCLLLLTAILCCFPFAFSQKRIGYEKPGDQEKRMAWWTNDRFGMFIHWGLYALPARHEWVKKYEKLTSENYQKYFEQFNPDLYNPKEWAKAAKAAGMKYAVITTKHHEGFCMFDSKFTDYKATNTQAKRDLIKEWVEAFRAEGLKVGFYYSLLDWHHPDFTVDKHHPQQPADNSDSAYARLNQGKDMSKYREYMHNQVRELLTNYGKIDIMWLDFSYPGKNGKGHEDWGSEELMKMMHKLQPGLIVDNRLDLNDYEDGFDFVTPEQVVVSEWPTVNGKKVAWETCQTFSGSWGYHRDEDSWKSPNQLLQLLIGSVSKGGNLLLNVGPTARGLFDYRATNALNAIGEWMQLNSKSIYGCTQAPEAFKAPEGTMLTYNPATKKLYVHVFVWPLNRLVLPGFDEKVKYVQFLHDNSEIKYLGKENQGSKDLVLTMPVKKPAVEIPVIELTLR